MNILQVKQSRQSVNNPWATKYNRNQTISKHTHGTVWHQRTLTSHQSEILHSLIFLWSNKREFTTFPFCPFLLLSLDSCDWVLHHLCYMYCSDSPSSVTLADLLGGSMAVTPLPTLFFKQQWEHNHAHNVPLTGFLTDWPIIAEQ